ncbi:MAG: hypothetical protein IJ514_05865 [Clostridia bacterium]|nr:hypothetical protein [Clostridia bacterium]
MKKRTFGLGVCALIMAATVVGGVNATTASAATEIGGARYDLSSFATYYGASVRMIEDSKGLRFTTGIDADVYDSLQADPNVSFGTIIAPAEYLAEGEEMTHANLAEEGLLDIPAATFITDETKVEVEGNVEFTGVITNIKDYNVNRAFRSRAYIKYDNGTDEAPSYYYAGYYTDEKMTTIEADHDNSRSVTQTAYILSTSGKAWETDQRAVLDRFVSYRPTYATEDFERSFSVAADAAIAFGVEVNDGTIAVITTETKYDGKQALRLSGEERVGAKLHIASLQTLQEGDGLKFYATADVAVSDFNGNAFTVSKTQVGEWTEVALTANDAATAKADGGFVVTGSESVCIDGIQAVLKSVYSGGDKTLNDMISARFGACTVSAVKGVQKNGESVTLDTAATLLQKTATYSAEITVSADGFNAKTLTINYEIDPTYTKGSKYYPSATPLTIELQNDGASQAFTYGSSTYTRALSAANGYTVKDERLLINLDHGNNAVQGVFDGLDTTGYGALRIGIATDLTISSNVTSGSSVNVYVDINGTYCASYEKAYADQYEIYIPVSALPALRESGNTLTLYSAQTNQEYYGYIDYIVLTKEMKVQGSVDFTATGADYSYSTYTTARSMPAPTEKGLLLYTTSNTEAASAILLVDSLKMIADTTVISMSFASVSRSTSQGGSVDLNTYSRGYVVGLKASDAPSTCAYTVTSAKMANAAIGDTLEKIYFRNFNANVIMTAYLTSIAISPVSG